MTLAKTGRLNLAWVLVALALVACSDDQPAPDGGDPKRALQILNSGGQDVALRPNHEASLRLRYTDGLGTPVAHARVQFAIFGDPKGSTLSADTAATDEQGAATIKVRAGASQATFRVQVSAPGAAVTFYIEVTNAALGALRVQSSYSGSLAQISLVKVIFNLVSGTTCSAIDPLAPPKDSRERSAGGIGQPVTFGAVPLDRDYVVLGRAADAKGVARARGCLAVPRTVLEADQTVQVTMDLADLLPRVAGTFTVTTRLVIPQGPGSAAVWPRSVAEAVRPWVDLADCHHDPAQLMLDCVLDAAEGSDPLDCVEPAKPTTTRGMLLAAERGVLAGACRGDTTARGSLSLDKRLREVMESTGKAPLVALTKVEDQALAVIGTLSLETSLELAAPDAKGISLATHRLQQVTFGSAKTGQVSYKAQDIGLAAPRADSIRALISTNWQLDLARHELSLRYGLVARYALGDLVLAKAGLPGRSTALVAKLVGKIKQTQGSKSLSGCPALEAVTCEAARLGPGCLGQACAQGMAALATLLDRGFVALDSHAQKGADMRMQGMVPLLDDDADLRVDRLGSSGKPGVWTFRLGLADQLVEPKEASFTGKRK